MGRTRTRIVLGALGVAVIPIVAVVVPLRRGSDDLAVGTGGGPAADVAPEASTPDITTVPTEPTSSPSTAPRLPTTTRRTTAQTTGTSAPTAGTPADGRGPGPQTLLGRLVFSQEDSATEESLWSARLDGSDKRREVDCPPPESPPPAVLPKDYWVSRSTFDISPDGTHVVRSCLVKAPGTTGRNDAGEFALVVQDVDGVGYTELWRYSLTREHVYPWWSPDGGQIVVWTEDALILVRPDGTGKRAILPSPPTSAQRLTWSPDGTRLVTDSLDILTIATGQWEQPIQEHGTPMPYRGMYEADGVVAWKPDGIWLTTKFTSVTGPPNGPETLGLYHLDPATGVVTQAQQYERLVIWGQLFGEDVYTTDTDGEHSVLLRVTPDGAVHAIGDLRPSFIRIPTG